MDVLLEPLDSRSHVASASSQSDVCLYSLRALLTAISHIYLLKASSKAAVTELGRYPNAKRYCTYLNLHDATIAPNYYLFFLLCTNNLFYCMQCLYIYIGYYVAVTT